MIISFPPPAVAPYFGRNADEVRQVVKLEDQRQLREGGAKAILIAIAAGDSRPPLQVRHQL